MSSRPLRRAAALLSLGLLALVATACPPQPPTPTPATPTGVATGSNHSCALMSDGSIRCWGFNLNGELGNDSVGPETPTPVEVEGSFEATELDASGSLTCAIDTVGGVWCWGANDAGQAGQEAGSPVLTPQPVVLPGGAKAIEIGVSVNHACAVTAATTADSSGAVVCWGSNSQGQLGDGSFVDSPLPVAVTGLSEVTDLGLGGDQTCAIDGGAVMCWGANPIGFLGVGSGDPQVTTPTPVIIGHVGPGDPITEITEPITGPALTSATDVEIADGQLICAAANVTDGLPGADAPHGALTLVPTVESRTWCWGYGSKVVGLESHKWGLIYDLLPAAVEADPAGDGNELAVGSGFVCRTTPTGQLRCWGDDNGYGSFGNGTTDPSVVPVPVTGVGTVTDIDTAWAHACARSTDAKVRCWGRNVNFQLGNTNNTGVADPNPTPVVVAGL